MLNTRDRILDTALELFSHQGYHAVSVRALAKALGFTEAALYKHFPSKRAVFEALVTRQQQWTLEAMAQVEAQATPKAEAGSEPGAGAGAGNQEPAGPQYPVDTQHPVGMYEDLDHQAFVDLGMRFFVDLLMRPEVMAFWRMVMIEQYHDPEMAAIYRQELVDGPRQYQTHLFSQLIARGHMEPYYPELLARAFFSPALQIYFELLGGHTDEKTALEALEAHFRHFRSVYSLPKEDCHG